MNKIFLISTLSALMLACNVSALAQTDSIQAAQELESRLENYYQLPPEDKEKLKTLLQKEAEQKKQTTDSLIMCEDDTVCLKEIRTSLYRQYETLRQKIYLEKDEKQKKRWQYALQNVEEQIIQVKSRLDFLKKTQANKTVRSGELDFLKKLEGKYPYDVKLFKKKAFKKRLENLLGDRCAFLIKNFDVQIPIEIINDVFITFACQAHSCGTTDFIIVYDFKSNVLSAGIRDNEQVEIYSENCEEIPEKITEWAN